ncbi:hypothetical protein L6452_11315 [Arctium lappa]|uniref:Uncharacterized protein n=1 Tax=Arctium lappa TaxID=4217 RepID=A0ACB9DP33_ARCLA|nr:hypothetical protein L6452_11315 [Arctium lappa]
MGVSVTTLPLLFLTHKTTSSIAVSTPSLSFHHLSCLPPSFNPKQKPISPFHSHHHHYHSPLPFSITYPPKTHLLSLINPFLDTKKKLKFETPTYAIHHHLLLIL